MTLLPSRFVLLSAFWAACQWRAVEFCVDVTAASATINRLIFAFPAAKYDDVVRRRYCKKCAESERKRNDDQAEGVDGHQTRSPILVSLKTTKPEPNQKVSLAEAQREQSFWEIRGVCSANSAPLRGVISLFILTWGFRALGFLLA